MSRTANYVHALLLQAKTDWDSLSPEDQARVQKLRNHGVQG